MSEQWFERDPLWFKRAVFYEIHLRGFFDANADGSGDFTRAIGLELDARRAGLGMRSQRYSMLVDDGVVKTLKVEGPGKFEVSDADTMLKAL